MREDDDVYPNGEHFSQEMEMSIVKKKQFAFQVHFEDILF